MGLPKPQQKLTVEEYLEIERKAEFKSEFYRGEMFAMSGGTKRHSVIGGNVLSELHFKLKGHPCRPYNSDLRVMSPSGLWTYPDVSVACGANPSDDETADLLRNPVLIIEVLSDSTEGYDRGKKFDHYRTIESLKEYVLISQNEPMVLTFLRLDDGCWKMQPIHGLEQSVKFESINVVVPMTDIYRDVSFEPPPASNQTTEASSQF